MTWKQLKQNYKELPLQRTMRDHCRWRIPRTKTWTSGFRQKCQDNNFKGGSPLILEIYAKTNKQINKKPAFLKAYFNSTKHTSGFNATRPDLSIANDSPKLCRPSQLDFNNKTHLKNHQQLAIYMWHILIRKCMICQQNFRSSCFLFCFFRFWKNNWMLKCTLNWIYVLQNQN